MEGDPQQTIGWVTARDNNKNPIYLEVVVISQQIPRPITSVSSNITAVENDDELEELYGSC